MGQRFERHTHSDYFHRAHFTSYWIPTLVRVDVSVPERGQVTDVLDLAGQTVAGRLGIAPGLIRANVFVPDETQQIPDPDAAGGVLGVFGLDCLEHAKSREDLAPLLPDLVVVAQSLGLVFKRLS